MDRQTQEAIEAGQRNRATIELVRNWCAHAQIEKFGGVGMIEQMTGLPIGHHGLKCEHATAGGRFSWDLQDSALDFYDRNCVDCNKRKPVGLPNLVELVKEREERRAAKAGTLAAQEASEAAAKAARRAKRATLRAGMSPLAAAIVEHIDEFDDERDQEHRDRLCESARLAPEHFVPSIVEHVFELTERELWFSDAGLTILDHLQADPKRIAKLALASLPRTWPIDTHARVVLARLPVVDAAQISDALPAIIELASPYDDFPMARELPPAKPELLHGLWAAYPAAVREGIDKLLSSRRLDEVELAARGLIVLHDRDPDAMQSFLRAMVSKFARANLLVDDFDDPRNGFLHLRIAIVAAFTRWPQEVDALVQEYIAASDRASKDRAYKIYEAAFRGHRYDDPPISPDSQVHRLSFQRLLWAATRDESEEVMRCVREVFQGRPYEMIDIARAELDGMLGALFLVDDRLRRHDEAPSPKGEIVLEVLERNNRRSTILGLMSSLVEWVSISAKDDPALIKKIVDMIDRIPEDREHLKGVSLGCLEHIGETVEGLNLVLPHIYYGLVGASVVVRSYAATALGKARNDNIPPLVYEAFSVLLWDQYVMVHKSAVHALSYFLLPDSMRVRSAQALLNLVRHYSQKSNEDHFLVECVERLANELRRLKKERGDVGKFLITVLMSVEPLYLKNKIRWIARTLGKTEGFIDLLLKLIPLVDDRDHRREDEFSLLADLPIDAVLSRREAIEGLGVELAPGRPWLALHLIEVLARAGAWSEARKIAESGAVRPEPNTFNAYRRLLMQSVKIAASFEEAVAEGRTERLGELSQEWEEYMKQRKEFDADVERRNSRSGFPRSL